MPEGDTIHRFADRLGRALVGHDVHRFYAPTLRGPAPRAGETVTAVEAVGKHLLMRFSGGLTLETHMQMHGTWTVYERRDRAPRPGPDTRVLLETDTAVAVCRRAPTVRTWRRPDTLTHLGPDLCQEFDLDEVVARMRRTDPRTGIADVLLDQRNASGIGNVYKSEVLWACRVDPFTAIGTMTDDDLRAIVETAARQLRANLDSGPRSTVPGGGLAVYRRAGRSCLHCRTPIVMRRQGEHARSTYFCPKCQRPAIGKNGGS